MVMAFALLYTGTGIEVPSYAEARLPFKVDHSFVSSLYFSIVTFTTLGFGDFRPVPAARFLAAGEALIGFVSPGAFLAALIEMLRGRKR